MQPNLHLAGTSRSNPLTNSKFAVGSGHGAQFDLAMLGRLNW